MHSRHFKSSREMTICVCLARRAVGDAGIWQVHDTSIHPLLYLWRFDQAYMVSWLPMAAYEVSPVIGGGSAYCLLPPMAAYGPNIRETIKCLVLIHLAFFLLCILHRFPSPFTRFCVFQCYVCHSVCVLENTHENDKVFSSWPLLLFL